MADVLDIQARIQQLEEDLMDRRRELATLRGQLPPEDVANFQLLAVGRRVSLKEAFGKQDEMIVIHNMGASCSYCTLWADGFNGVLPHLENRAAFVVVSPDRPDEQRLFALSRGWKFTMLSDPEGEFTRSMGFLREESHEQRPWPGVSAFSLTSSGQIQRTGRAEFGPGDLFCPAWHLFGLLKKGVNDWEPKRVY